MAYGTINADKLVGSSGGTISPDSSVFRNRIINGAMVIDQRNAGASVTVNNAAALTYTVDRFYGYGQSADGVFTVQQDTSVPTGQGFRNSIKVTVTTADASIGATQLYQLGQRIEGFNVADFGLGTANASTITLSFWVRSSLTGTFGGAFMNGGQNRSYPFSYTINSANTWEQKTITFTGDTSGTWLTTNGTGLEVIWGLGVGSTYLGTANAWAGSYLSGVTGQTQVISTLNATFYITGVQLEKGSTATSFDYRPYGTELQLCQRYFQKLGSADGSTYANGPVVGFGMQANQLTNSNIFVPIFQIMRGTPTVGYSNLSVTDNLGYDAAISAISATNLGQTGGGHLNVSHASSGTAKAPVFLHVTNSTAGFLSFSAEL